MSMIFKKYGIKEEDELDDGGITYFLKEIYLKCQDVNLTPPKVFIYIYDIITFSRTFNLSNTSISKKEERGKRRTRDFYPKFESKNKCTTRYSK